MARSQFELYLLKPFWSSIYSSFFYLKQPLLIISPSISLLIYFAQTLSVISLISCSCLHPFHFPLSTSKNICPFFLASISSSAFFFYHFSISVLSETWQLVWLAVSSYRPVFFSLSLTFAYLLSAMLIKAKMRINLWQMHVWVIEERKSHVTR